VIDLARFGTYVIRDGAMTCLQSLSSRIPPVQIYVSPALRPLGDRIELSRGTRVADEHEVGDGGYEEGARLPREPWRLPTKEEVQRLVAAELPRDMAQSVAIVKLPGSLSDECRDAIRNNNNEAIQSNVIGPLQTICELGEPLNCIGPTSYQSNLKTTTVNRDLRRYIGLHVDNWDQLDVEYLDRATNRVCVNIGERHRHFLFLPFPLTKIVSRLADEMGADWVPPGRHTLIARQFMELFSDLPVIRCRLAPGEAYIAPTENLIHDGSSLGKDKIDEVFTILGHIKVRERERFGVRHFWTKALALVGG
jgi:hypothetical protein